MSKELVTYHAKDGHVVKGVIVQRYTSVYGVKCISIDNFANSIPLARAIKIEVIA